MTAAVRTLSPGATYDGVIEVHLPAPRRTPAAHGTRRRYLAGPDQNDQPGRPCRCLECRAANTDTARAYHRRKAREAWGATPPMHVETAPVRDHIRHQMRQGLGWRRTAELAGLNPNTVRHILYGTNGRPATRTRSDIAAKLLAVTAAEHLADGQHVDATGTRRRIQALVAIGWTNTELSARIGRAPSNFRFLLIRTTVTAGLARRVTGLYDDLWNQPPPGGTARQRNDAQHARGRARRNGWPPPVAWNDDTIDDPHPRHELNARAQIREASA